MDALSRRRGAAAIPRRTPRWRVPCSAARRRRRARAALVLNAGAAIYVGGGADSIEEGVRAAERAIDSGAAPPTAGALRRSGRGAGAA